MIKKFSSSITIAIPAYNEAENLTWVIKDALASLKKYFSDFEIVIVDDGSADSTGKIADRLAQKYRQIRVVHQLNGGYSQAMLTGIRKAKKQFVAFLPADGQFLIKDMLPAFAMMPTADLVLGYRDQRPDYTFYRMILSYGYLLLLWLLFGIHYKDVGWVNIWRTKAVQRLKLQGTRGIFLLTEIIVRFNQLGLIIKEVPSVYRPRRSGEVKNAKLRVVFDTFYQAIKLWWKIVLGKKE